MCIIACVSTLVNDHLHVKLVIASFSYCSHLSHHTRSTKLVTANLNFKNAKRHPVSCAPIVVNDLLNVICVKNHSLSSGLKLHMLLIHTGEQPFKCQVCQWAFSRMNHLKFRAPTLTTDHLIIINNF